eukprot:g5323.t1
MKIPFCFLLLLLFTKNVNGQQDEITFLHFQFKGYETHFNEWIPNTSERVYKWLNGGISHSAKLEIGAEVLVTSRSNDKKRATIIDTYTCYENAYCPWCKCEYLPGQNLPVEFYSVDCCYTHLNPPPDENGVFKKVKYISSQNLSPEWVRSDATDSTKELVLSYDAPSGIYRVNFEGEEGEEENNEVEVVDECNAGKGQYCPWCLCDDKKHPFYRVECCKPNEDDYYFRIRWINDEDGVDKTVRSFAPGGEEQFDEWISTKDLLEFGFPPPPPPPSASSPPSIQGTLAWPLSLKVDDEVTLTSKKLNYVLIELDTDDSMVVVGDRRVHLLRDTDRDVEDETGVEGGDTDLRQYRRARVVHVCNSKQGDRCPCSCERTIITSVNQKIQEGKAPYQQRLVNEGLYGVECCIQKKKKEPFQFEDKREFTEATEKDDLLEAEYAKLDMRCQELFRSTLHGFKAETNITVENCRKCVGGGPVQWMPRHCTYNAYGECHHRYVEMDLAVLPIARSVNECDENFDDVMTRHDASTVKNDSLFLKESLKIREKTRGQLSDSDARLDRSFGEKEMERIDRNKNLSTKAWPKIEVALEELLPVETLTRCLSNTPEQCWEEEGCAWEEWFARSGQSTWQCAVRGKAPTPRFLKIYLLAEQRHVETFKKMSKRNASKFIIDLLFKQMAKFEFSEKPRKRDDVNEKYLYDAVAVDALNNYHSFVSRYLRNAAVSLYQLANDCFQSDRYISRYGFHTFMIGYTEISKLVKPPVAIFVLGAAAAGKTTATKMNLQQILFRNEMTEKQRCFISIDGGIMREESITWNEINNLHEYLLSHVPESEGLLGFKDSHTKFQKYTSPFKKYLIRSLTKEIPIKMEDGEEHIVPTRSDLIIPDTANPCIISSGAKCPALSFGDELKETGYQVIYTAMNTDECNTHAQGYVRSGSEGKEYELETKLAGIKLSDNPWLDSQKAIKYVMNKARDKGNKNVFLIMDGNNHSYTRFLQNTGTVAECRTSVNTWIGRTNRVEMHDLGQVGPYKRLEFFCASKASKVNAASCYIEHATEDHDGRSGVCTCGDYAGGETYLEEIENKSMSKSWIANDEKCKAVKKKWEAAKVRDDGSTSICTPDIMAACELPQLQLHLFKSRKSYKIVSRCLKECCDDVWKERRRRKNIFFAPVSDYRNYDDGSLEFMRTVSGVVDFLDDY